MSREQLIVYFDRRINAIDKRIERVHSENVKEMLIIRRMEAIEIASGLGLNVKKNSKTNTYIIF